MQKKVKFCNYYDEKFKKAVILDVTKNHLNYHEVVRKYWNVLTEKDIDRYRTTVRRWVKGYQRNGGINFMPAFNERKLLDENGDRSKPLEEYTREELIAENEAYKKSLKYKLKKIFEKEVVEKTIPELRPEAEIINTNTEMEIENNAQE